MNSPESGTLPGGRDLGVPPPLSCKTPEDVNYSGMTVGILTAHLRLYALTHTHHVVKEAIRLRHITRTSTEDTVTPGMITDTNQIADTMEAIGVMAITGVMENIETTVTVETTETMKDSETMGNIETARTTEVMGTSTETTRTMTTMAGMATTTTLIDTETIRTMKTVTGTHITGIAKTSADTGAPEGGEITTVKCTMDSTRTVESLVTIRNTNTLAIVNEMVLILCCRSHKGHIPTPAMHPSTDPLTLAVVNKMVLILCYRIHKGHIATPAMHP